MVQECPPLVVIAPLHFLLVMDFTPLEVHQVCSGRLETGFKVVLGPTTVFPQFLQMVRHDWDVVIPLLSM